MYSTMLDKACTDFRPGLERALDMYLPLLGSRHAAVFNEAVHYAMFPGGKRIRPMMVLLVAEALGGDRRAAMPIAVAAEYVHASSLIFDDLPAMDNAAKRRGRPSVHAAYGEAIAVLAAIALLNRSYELPWQDRVANSVRIHHELTWTIGSAGMTGGQVEDLLSRENAAAGSLSGVDNWAEQSPKTTSLFRFCLVAGALSAGGRAPVVANLGRFADAFGAAFQLRDDMCDAEEDRLLAARVSAPGTAPVEPKRAAFEQAREAARNTIHTFRGRPLREVLSTLINESLSFPPARADRHAIMAV